MQIAPLPRGQSVDQWWNWPKRTGGSDVDEMFEILPRDWKLKPIFTQKWASVDMNWKRGRGLNPFQPPLPRQFQPYVRRKREINDSSLTVWRRDRRWYSTSCWFYNKHMTHIHNKHFIDAFSFLADRTNGRAIGTVLRLSSVVCLSVTLCIVAKRCILEQKLLLRAYRKSYMRNRLVPKLMTLTFV